MTFSPKAIEAAARALCVQSGDDPDKLTYAHAMQCTGHDREPKFTWQYWIPFAEAALTAALAVDGMALQGWQDISTAPKDGRYIIAGRFRDDEMKWVKRSRWMSAEEACEEEGGASADDYDAGWTDGEDEHDYCYPTHWQQLPPPPAASDREERR